MHINQHSNLYTVNFFQRNKELQLKRIRYSFQRNKEIQVRPVARIQQQGGQIPEGGAKNQKRGQHFKNTVLDVCSNRWAKREMGGTDFKWGVPGTNAPRWRRPCSKSKVLFTNTDNQHVIRDPPYTGKKSQRNQ